MVLLVWFVSFIWLNQTDQMNQINSSRRMLKKTVQQGPSNSLYLSLGEGPRLSFTARIERAQFHRARSASKKGTWPLPPCWRTFSASC